MSNTTLWVSAYIDIGSNKTHEKRISHFQTLYDSISPHSDIVVFCCQTTFPLLNEIYSQKPNIKLILFDYTIESWIYKVCEPYCDKTPNYVNPEKDTFLYLCLIQMKIEFLYKAIVNARENSKQYNYVGWIDFSLPYLFKTPDLTIGYLRFLSAHLKHLKPDRNFLAIPGCISEIVNPNPHYVHWRFCGGFLFGNTESLVNFHKLYELHFENMLKEDDCLTWEVNTWSKLEAATHKLEAATPGLNAIWYNADHNDTIVRIPSKFYAKKLESVKHTYNYPVLAGFAPSSASFICIEKTDCKKISLLITRFVNYTIDSEGRFVIQSLDGFAPGTIVTKNIISVLSENLEQALNYVILNEDNLGLPENREGPYIGLEDMRVFKNTDRDDFKNTDHANTIEFIAATASYNINGTIRLLQGTINLDTRQLENGRILQPPTHTNCEKNWIPIGSYNRCKIKKKQKYIYRWQPYEIGYINPETNQLTIESSRVVPNLLFDKVRGSSVPVWSSQEGCYICVVHYAEHGHTGLEYYHMLVKLAPETYDIIGWSEPFYFTRIGIQYCIGFTIVMDEDKETYVFWFSENDGNPGFIKSYSNQFVFV